MESNLADQPWKRRSDPVGDYSKENGLDFGPRREGCVIGMSGRHSLRDEPVNLMRCVGCHSI